MPRLREHPDSVVSIDSHQPSPLVSHRPLRPLRPRQNAALRLPPYRRHRQRLMASSSSHHLSRNPNNNAAEKKPPKKRANSFFIFFSVKEPSQQALEDYQPQLRITGGANSKDCRFDTVGLSGISSAKLPPIVSKVGSKWDGVPHPAYQGEGEGEAKAKCPSTLSRLYSFPPLVGIRDIWQHNTSSPTLSRSSSHYYDLSFSSFPLAAAAAAGRPPPFHKSGSSTLSDLYGWEKTGSGSNSISSGGDADGDGTHPGGGKKIKDRSKQKLSRKTSSYLQAPPPPVPRSIPNQYLEPNLSDLGALLGPPTDQSSSPSPDLDNPFGSSLSGEGLNAPPGHSSTNAPNIKPSATSCPDDEPLVQSHTFSSYNILRPSFSSIRENPSPEADPAPSP